VPELPSDLSLRELSLDDAASVAALVDACDRTFFDFAPPGWQPPGVDKETAKWTERLTEADRWSCGAFDGEDALVGFAAMLQARTDGEPSETIPGVGYLEALFVHPRRWREGIASRLLEGAESAMRERGFERGQLRTTEGVPARRFYEARGWSATGQSWYHEVFGMTMVGYEKRLVDSDP
jgi:GNAT superfamily N-acetyltransferase